MSPAKRFLLITAGVSFVVWLTGNILWGPPDYSPKYLSQYKAEHDRYLTITKSEAYKRYLQRPALIDPAGSEAFPNLASDLAFVQQYEARPEFQAEQHRRHIYYLYFEIFNAVLLVVIVVYLGKKPFLGFLDGKITELQETIEEAAKAKAEAEEKIAEANAKIKNLDTLRHGIESEVDARIQQEIQTLGQAHQTNKQQHLNEIEDRKKLEEQRASAKVKMELAKLAVQQLAEDCKKTTPQRHVDWIDEFCADVEGLA